MKRIHKSTFTAIIFTGLLLTMISSPAQALPPDPDNAALLYYQGFLSLPELSKEAIDHIEDVAKGEIKPDDQVREDISKCNSAIHFADAGAKLPACNWGVEFSQGFDTLMPQLAQMRLMSFVLLADARVRAADGDYRAALERCIMTDTFAYHAGDDTFISYLVSLHVRYLAYSCIQDIIGRDAGDVEQLLWLKNELAKSMVNTLSLTRPIKFEIEITTDLMRPENIEKLARVLADFDDKKISEIIRKADGKTLEQGRRIYSERMNSMMSVLSTSMPYEEAHSQLKQLEGNFDQNDPVSAAAKTFVPTVARIVTLKTRAEAHANALKAGIEILLDHARKGRLGDTLPAELPKDAFSGKDFEYEKTKDGFILRCRGKDLDKDEINQYEFKLSK